MLPVERITEAAGGAGPGSCRCRRMPRTPRSRAPCPRAAPHARQRGARGLARAWALSRLLRAWRLKTIEPDHNWIVLKIFNEKTRNILKLSPVMIAAAGTVLLLTAHCSTLVALSPRAIFCSERTRGNTNYSQYNTTPHSPWHYSHRWIPSWSSPPQVWPRGTAGPSSRWWGPAWCPTWTASCWRMRSGDSTNGQNGDRVK